MGVERILAGSEALESSYRGVRLTLSRPLTPPGSLGIVMQASLPGPEASL